MTLLTLLEPPAPPSSGLTVEIPDAVPLRITGDITLEMWVVSMSKGQYGAIIGKLNTADTYAEPYYLGVSSGSLYFSLGNGSSQTFIASPGEISVGTPIHIVATCFRKNMSLYIDGNKIISKSLGSQEVKDGGKPVFIGAFGNETNRFNGLIGEIALYNGALGETTIKEHFAIGRQIIYKKPYYTTYDPPSYS